MDFYKIIKSLDDLLFEILSWLLFYPLTLIRILVSPVETMRKVERELVEDEEHKFDEMLGPPLFLAITLGLIHMGELFLVPEGLGRGSGPLAEFMADDRNLLALRIVMFGALPLVAAVRLLRSRGQPIDKSHLRAPVYAQCYAAGVFAILFNTAFLGVAAIDGLPDEGRGMVVLGGLAGALFWLGWVEARWFHRKLSIGRGKALAHSSVVLFEWLAVLVLVALLFD